MNNEDQNQDDLSSFQDIEAESNQSLEVLKEGIADVYYTVAYNLSAFLGVGLMAFSVLNFNRGRYCDGTPADHFSCLNSATYYEYSWLMIGLFVFGSLCLTYWCVRRKTL